MKLKSFHFNCGNSSTGAIGLCARVVAHSKTEAVKMLNNALRFEERSIFDHAPPEYKKKPWLDYCRVYFGKVTIKDIDEVNEID